MNIIDDIKKRAREKIRRIVLPESDDERVIDAGIKASNEGIADIILIGNEDKVKDQFSSKDFSKVTFIDPEKYERINEFVIRFYEMRKSKGVTLDEATDLIKNNYLYFACMLVNEGLADGVVSGANHSSSDTLRPALQIIKTSVDAELVSAFFLMVVPNTSYGENGVFIFSDAGLVQNPNVHELAAIAYSSSKSFELLVGVPSKVAFLSHSTYGSAKHDDVDKVRRAFELAKIKYPDMISDGELQLDAAIDEDVAFRKAPDSSVAGHANTLIFPDLDAGNIGYKLVQRLAASEAYGPITQGIRKPVNDLSRGASVDDIVGVIAITAVQCED